jgi:hypothetical protein
MVEECLTNFYTFWSKFCAMNNLSSLFLNNDLRHVIFSFLLIGSRPSHPISNDNHIYNILRQIHRFFTSCKLEKECLFSFRPWTWTTQLHHQVHTQFRPNPRLLRITTANILQDMECCWMAIESMTNLKHLYVHGAGDHSPWNRFTQLESLSLYANDNFVIDLPLQLCKVCVTNNTEMLYFQMILPPHLITLELATQIVNIEHFCHAAKLRSLKLERTELFLHDLLSFYKLKMLEELDLGRCTYVGDLLEQPVDQIWLKLQILKLPDVKRVQNSKLLPILGQLPNLHHLAIDLSDESVFDSAKWPSLRIVESSQHTWNLVRAQECSTQILVSSNGLEAMIMHIHLRSQPLIFKRMDLMS